MDIRDQTQIAVGAVIGKELGQALEGAFSGHILDFMSSCYHMSLVGHLVLLWSCVRHWTQMEGLDLLPIKGRRGR